MDKQEPVAWMYRREYDGWIKFSLERDFSRMPPFTDEGVWTETPLYTLANRPADDGLVEELVVAISDLAVMELDADEDDPRLSYFGDKVRALVEQTLTLTTLRAQSDAEVERIVAYVRREGGTVGEWLAMGIEAGEHRKGGA